MTAAKANKGAVAAGNPDTVAAARTILEEGGNAFDAALAAMTAACVAEPVLSSLGGGGFLLATPAEGRPLLYDFFAHTPLVRLPGDECDFYPILCDFGTTQQEFHIGMGSIATPGAVKGMFEVHADLGRMPLKRIVEPALHLARDGFAMNPLQAYIFDVVGGIYMSTAASRAIFASRDDPERLIGSGETMSNPDFADALEVLAIEGADLFYRGEIAERIAADCGATGGTLTRSDLEAYRVVKRLPLERRFKGYQILTNPPPSTGGVLIAFALALIESENLAEAGFGSRRHLETLTQVMALTNEARVEAEMHELDEGAIAGTMLDPGLLETYRRHVAGHPPSRRGTTQVSIADGDGNAVAMTLSNGEGCGYIVPGTGIMLNNMLGEEDINPHGFHGWPTDRRMSSMMAPTIVRDADGSSTAVGSGGSNRIRTAILQVLLCLYEYGFSLEEAVEAPRLHFERGNLDIEQGFDEDIRRAFAADYEGAKLWDEKNLFFGGVHAVNVDAKRGGFTAAGDARRGGTAAVL